MLAMRVCGSYPTTVGNSTPCRPDRDERYQDHNLLNLRSLPHDLGTRHPGFASTSITECVARARLKGAITREGLRMCRAARWSVFVLRTTMAQIFAAFSACARHAACANERPSRNSNDQSVHWRLIDRSREAHGGAFDLPTPAPSTKCSDAPSLLRAVSNLPNQGSMPAS